jgi:hypothetical protein
MKNEMKGKAPTHSCECSPKDTNLHKLQAMGYNPKFEVSSPKTPA